MVLSVLLQLLFFHLFMWLRRMKKELSKLDKSSKVRYHPKQPEEERYPASSRL